MATWHNRLFWETIQIGILTNVQFWDGLPHILPKSEMTTRFGFLEPSQFWDDLESDVMSVLDTHGPAKHNQRHKTRFEKIDFD